MALGGHTKVSESQVVISESMSLGANEDSESGNNTFRLLFLIGYLEGNIEGGFGGNSTRAERPS